MIRRFFPAFLAISVLCGCMKQQEGTIVQISNETRFTIIDVQLITSSDTVLGTSISSSCIFTDTLILRERERIRISWMENGQYREFEKTLLDSVDKAKSIMISILPENDRFEIFYHF